MQTNPTRGRSLGSCRQYVAPDRKIPMSRDHLAFRCIASAAVEAGPASSDPSSGTLVSRWFTYNVACASPQPPNRAAMASDTSTRSSGNDSLPGSTVFSGYREGSVGCRPFESLPRRNSGNSMIVGCRSVG
jgi:hypothetical protein